LEYGAKSLSDGSVPWTASVHPGIDLVCDSDATIKAIHGGTVIRSKTSGSWGSYVVIEQEDGLSAIYAHLNARFVEVGDNVAEGQFVGVMGNSGNVNGTHLHLEIQSDYYNAYSHQDIAEYLGIKNEVGFVQFLD
jgi:murein DD-endopeptidase MepM/ murein hydrolase activator NlpD